MAQSVSEFRSVVDTVANCAIEIQRAMGERNAEVAPDKRIEFRIGIHLGDVVEESDGDLADGRRRRHRRALAGGRQARRDLPLRSKPIGWSKDGSISRSATALAP